MGKNLAPAAIIIGAVLFFGTKYLLFFPEPTPLRPIHLYSNQTRDDLTRIFAKAVDEAKESVHLVIYSINDLTLLNALKQKALSGVSVKLIYDTKATGEIERLLPKEVELIPYAGKGIGHQKILVIDHERVWLGSSNWTTASLKYHRNLVAGMYCPDLASHIETSDDLYEGQIGKNPIEMWTLPNLEAPKRVIELIRSAKKTLKVAMFTFTRQDFTSELIAARDRGVDVRVVVDRQQAMGTNKKIVQRLFQENLPIRLSEGGALLHHKMMVVDDHTLVNGSANWTDAAFTKNGDCFIVLKNLSGKQRRYLDRLWNIIEQEASGQWLTSGLLGMGRWDTLWNLFQMSEGTMLSSTQKIPRTNHVTFL